MKKKHTLQPLEMTNFLTKADPDIWGQLYDKDGQASAILCKKYADKNYPDTAGMLYALAVWRQHKIIYDFDNEIAKMLKDMGTVDDDIPCEAIMHLPYNGLYLQLPDKVFSYVEEEKWLGQVKKERIYVDGFFFSIDTSTVETLKKIGVEVDGELSLATFDMVFTNHRMMTLCIPLSENHTFKSGFEYMNNNGYAHNESSIELCNELLQLVLYLSAVNADIEEDAEQKEIKERAEKKKAERSEQEQTEPTKSKEISYKELQKWNVGYRYGTAVKKARQAERKKRDADTEQERTARQGSHSRKRTHARRGHFHHFWTGSRKGERQLVLKWVSPVIVNAEYENIVTIHKVK